MYEDRDRETMTPSHTSVQITVTTNSSVLVVSYT
jgi:hypothetical protein